MLGFINFISVTIIISYVLQSRELSVPLGNCRIHSMILTFLFSPPVLFFFTSQCYPFQGPGCYCISVEAFVGYKNENGFSGWERMVMAASLFKRGFVKAAFNLQ